jgi:hypothetical protein
MVIYAIPIHGNFYQTPVKKSYFGESIVYAGFFKMYYQYKAHKVTILYEIHIISNILCVKL